MPQKFAHNRGKTILKMQAYQLDQQSTIVMPEVGEIRFTSLTQRKKLTESKNSKSENEICPHHGGQVKNGFTGPTIMQDVFVL